ncbi:unnamed protein product [Gemmataceae bacterium]|nr:unnamed protein product [Gemmataceae bacterium]VTT98284.1 unnamed protein product [Gemmataceae bacterium]
MPESDDDAPRLPADVLKRVAHYQRWVIACVLSQLTMWLGILVLSILNGGWVDFEVPVALSFVVDLAGAAFAFLIYWVVRSPVWAVGAGLGVIALVLAVLALDLWLVAPVVGLLLLTVANGVATRALGRNGVRVGFFGADLNEIADDGFGADDDEDAGW